MVTCGHWQPHNIICGIHCADAVFNNVYLQGQRFRDCCKEILKDPNINLIMEQIKLQCLCSVEPKDVTGTSKIKTKLGKLAPKWWLCENKYIAQIFMIN